MRIDPTGEIFIHQPEDFIFSLETIWLKDSIPVEIKIECQPKARFLNETIRLEQFKHYFINKGLTARHAANRMHLGTKQLVALMANEKTKKELESLIETYGNIPGPLRRDMLRAVENKILLENMDGNEKQQRLAMDVIKGMRTDPELGMLAQPSAAPQLGEGLKKLFEKLSPGSTQPAIDAEFEEVKQIEGKKDE